LLETNIEGTAEGSTVSHTESNGLRRGSSWGGDVPNRKKKGGEHVPRTSPKSGNKDNQVKIRGGPIHFKRSEAGATTSRGSHPKKKAGKRRKSIFLMSPGGNRKSSRFRKLRKESKGQDGKDDY